MTFPAPIYTAANCRFTGELNWGLSIFWREPTENFDWLPELTAALKPDDIRILKHRFRKPGVSQFEIASTFPTPPLLIVQRVKGRLQHLIRKQLPKPFQKNYGMRSIGFVNRKVIEQYVASQLGHHRMADENVQRRLARFQIHQPEVDLSHAQATTHALYWYNLHVTLVHEGRAIEVREESLTKVRDMILGVSKSKRHLLSRAGILADHLHLALGCPIEVSPAAIALCYLNNLAYAQGMKPVYQFGAHIRTFSEYDLGAVKGKAPE